MRKKLKKIKTLNDFVAIVQNIDVPDIEMPEETRTHVDEGIVVGIGPDVGLEAHLKLGDKVILQPGRYINIKPDAGDYQDRPVVIVKGKNLIAVISHSDIEFYDD